MKQLIAQRLKRVVARETHDIILDTLTEDEADELQQARQQERQARVNALARSAARNENGAARQSHPSAGASPSAIDELEAEEDCPVCRSILTAVSEMDEPRRTRGIAEYGSFRTASNISEEKAIEVLENSEILKDALEDVQQVRP